MQELRKYIALGASAIAIIITYSEPALAAFDLAKGVKAGTDPLVALTRTMDNKKAA